MTLLQLFRLWARRAPGGERLGAAAGAALGLVVLCWLLVPASTAGSGGVPGGPAVAAAGTGGPVGGAGSGAAVGAGGPAGGAGSAAVSGTGGAGPTGAMSPVAGGTAPAGPGAGAPGSAGANCASPAGTDQGVTPTTIKVADLVLNLAGAVGNQTYHVPPPATQQAWFQAVVDSVNASGGVACRKIVPEYFQANAVDPAQLQQLCLEVVQTHPFFLFGAGLYLVVYPSLLSCYAQNQIPFLADTGQATAQQAAQWFPYAFFGYLSNQNYHNLIFALAQRGWFSAASGFRKLGVAYQDCDSQIPGQFFGWLQQAGVGSSQVTSYDLGCSGLFTSPDVIEQAILKFKADGVSNVTWAYDERDFANWTNIAEQQDFKPKYALSDETQIAVTYSNNGPNYDNIANAIAITDDADGEEHTPGMAPSALTQQCLALFGAKAAYPVASYDQMEQDGSQGGYCGDLWQFRAMVDHAPALRRADLAAGLQATGSMALPYPAAPVDWRAPRTTWGGQYWRVDQFSTGCDCWRVVDPNYHPPFQ